MDLPFLVLALLVLGALSYFYIVLVIANSLPGAGRVIGLVLGFLFLIVLALTFISYQTESLSIPNRLTRMTSVYVVRTLMKDEEAMDEFIEILKAYPEFYQKFKEKL